MLPLEECKKLQPKEILLEIQARKNLVNQMVGWLYTSILKDEINELIKFLSDHHNFSYVMGNYYDAKKTL